MHMCLKQVYNSVRGTLLWKVDMEAKKKGKKVGVIGKTVIVGTMHVSSNSK
jgi:hypothetical protein